MLEGAHHPFARDQMPRNALDLFARIADHTFTRPVETGQTVEDSGLTGTVRPYDGDDLFLLHLQGHLIDRHQTAKAHGEVRNFQHLAHFGNSMC